jgi:hypothetical protein
MFGVGALICFAILLLLAHLWRNAAVETARQKLFGIRNEMFGFWAETGLPFDHPAYTSLRGIMNHSIRFAHVIAPSRCWLPYLLYCYLKKSYGFQPPDYFGQFFDAVEAMNDKEIADALHERHTAVTTVLGNLFIFGSFSGWVAGFGFMAWATIKSVINGGFRETSSAVTNEACVAGVRAYNLALIAENQ